MENHRHRRAALRIFTVLLLIIAQRTATAQHGSNVPARASSQNPPSRVARLTQIQGQVSLQPAGVNDWTQATINYPLTTGDRMYVNQDGRAELQMEQTVIHVWHYSDLAVTNLSDSITQLGLSQGTLHVRTFELEPNRPVEVDTPNGAITVTQPGDFRVDVYTADGGTVVTVNSGEVRISGPKLARNVGARQSVRLTGNNPITLTTLTMPGKDPFDAWSEQRDRQLLSSNTRRFVDPNTIGSDDLDQFGQWTQTPAYGPVWYPTAVPVGWVPYSNGRWVWVSPWGWTWVDTFPWGFAPFHYGRWAYYDGRWGWIPGPYRVAPIYSPALVGFVGGPGFSVGVGVAGGVGLSAWFPLGPGEPYFPWYHCSPAYFTQVNVTNIQRMTINRANYYSYYHNTTTVNNIRYVNRNMATTAMRASDFASAHAITPTTAIHPAPQQLARAQIIPHPFIAPTARSVVPHPTTSVPVGQSRPRLVTPPAYFHAANASRSTAGSSQARSNPSNRALTQNTPKSLIGLASSPPMQPTFRQREPALRLDPGRPLGPRQIDNLRMGRPAGPARTPDFPPHPLWAPRPMMSTPRAGMRR